MRVSRLKRSPSLFSLIPKSPLRSLAAVTSCSNNPDSFDSIPHLENLVKTRSRAGNLGLDEAIGFFSSMIQMRPLPSTWAFNHLIGFLSKKNHFATVIDMYNQLLGRVDSRPDMCTMNVVIKCFCRLSLVGFAFSVLGTAIKSGFEPDAHSLNPLLHALCSSGSVASAMGLLQKVTENRLLCCNDIAYAIVVNGFCKAGETRKAIDLLQRMVEHSVDAFSPVIDRLCKEGKIDESLSLFGNMISRGILPDVVVYTSLIRGMCRFGRREEAMSHLVNMVNDGVSPNLRTFSAFIDSLCEEGRNQEAICLFELMMSRGVDPDIVTFNSLISSLCKSGQWKDVAALLAKMKSFGLSPDIVTFNVMLNARCKEGSLAEAFRIVEEMTEKGLLLLSPDNATVVARMGHSGKSEETNTLLYPNIRTLNIVLNALCEGGMVETARKLLEEMIEDGKEIHPISCNILIKGYCLQGEMDKARQTFDDMRAMAGFVPNSVSYNTLVNGYIKVKGIDFALEVLKEMIQEGLEPDSISRFLLKSIHAIRLESSIQL